MWIKSIVLDGFKSYAQRTDINGFDPYFNAITGLNGSGKSNILDGICFLLGITNLAHVRAVNLNELVYKNGQGAVTKATVSITFDNTDASQSPPGFNEFEEITITRQIAIGNRNKYMINGVAANNTRVQDLFRSVQLNVNNPHFLIMQGRITKVLNMKPQEILSMIEEATGTMMYENKKEISQKMIDKKNAKIREMDDLLNEDIIPRLTKYKEERASFLEYQKIVRELEHLNKFYVAFRYFCCEESRKKFSGDMQTLQEQVAKCKEDIVTGDKEIKELNVKLKEIQDKQGKEMEAALKVRQEKLEEALSAETIATSLMNARNNSLRSECHKLQEMEKQLIEEKNTLVLKENECQKAGIELKKLQEKNEKDKVAHGEAVRHLQAVRVGMATSSEGKDASVDEQLRAAKIAFSSAETEYKEAEIRLKHCKEELNAKMQARKRDENSYKVDEEKCEQLQKSIENLEMEVRKLDYEENSEERLLGELRRADSKALKLKERLNNLEARAHQLQFEYQDPEPNFNRRSVKGLVATLIKIKDSKNATALEVVAGKKLYQVIVDTEVTSKKILDRGRLKSRVTIIPLNKISGKPIPAEVVRKAESLVGKENVDTALSLVGYDAELEAAMAFVFGTSFVCVNMEVAKKVTFHSAISRKSVTINGDSFDPAGLASGGSRIQSESILLKFNELREVQLDCNTTSQQLEKLTSQYKNSQQMATRWRNFVQQLDLKRSELQMLKDKLKNSAHGQHLAEIEDLKTSIENLKEQLKESLEAKEKYCRQAEELEDMLKNKDAVMEREVRRAESDLQSAKKEFEASSVRLKNKEQEHNNLKLEFGEFEKELEELSHQLEVQKEVINDLKKQIADQEKELNAAKENLASCQEGVNHQKDLLKSCNSLVEKNHREQQDIVSHKNDLQLQIVELKHKMEQLKQDSKDTMDQFEELVSENPWINEEKKYFNQPNTSYDFKARNPTETLKKIHKLKSMKDKLSKNVNMRVMSMLSESEAQYNEVSEKKQSLIKDKNKIQLLMDKLDEKKNRAVKEAYIQVNKDFGSIFSTLLPGASAKLIPSEGDSILSGVEFKVGFGGVWKESLSELSGGQRSLVALSLILAMLLFKPAPLYILDEVDAALDLSHTQNIGHMLRTHFKHSQFIVVSLKDGMFNNANVLFKTKFVDGISTVARYAQRQIGQDSKQEQSRKRKKVA